MKREPSNGEVRQVALRLLSPHPFNRHFEQDNSAFREFVASVQAKGVLVPLICRPDPVASDGVLQVLSGHRRLAAAAVAGLATVPVLSREMDDRAAAEFVICENLERENPDPLEEAAGIARLLENGWDYDSIGSRIGRTAGWVARRARLSELAASVRELLADENVGPRMRAVPVGILERIARLPAAQQDQIAKSIKGGSMYWCLDDVKEFAGHLNDEFLRNLAEAPWSLDDATLHPQAGACSTCPKRSTQQPALWDDLAASEKGRKGGADKCLDAGCYAEKRRRQIAAVVKAADTRAGVPVLCFPGPDYDAVKGIRKQIGRGVVNEWETKAAKKSDPGAVPAITLTGAKAGQIRWVTPPKAREERTEAGQPEAKGKGKPKTLAEQREDLRRRREALVVDLFEKALKNPKALEGLDQIDLDEAAAIAAVFGTEEQWDLPKTPWKVVEKTTNLSASKLAERLLAIVLPSVGMSVKSYADVVDACEFLELPGLSIEELCDQAAKQIPEPASWKTLNEDGTPKTIAKKGGKAKKGQKVACAVCHGLHEVRDAL